MNLNATSIAFLALLSLSGCQENTESNAEKEAIAKQQDSQKAYDLIGKKARIVYPEFEAEVNYVSNTKLHWKTKDADGNVAEGNEEVNIKRLNNTQFFLNWIEKDGLTVSQVIDIKEGSVNAYLSWQDENSNRGQRSGNFSEGTWIEIK